MARLFGNDNSSQQRGKPVHIVREIEGYETLQVDHDALCSILCHSKIGDRPMSCIAIAGPLRSGKSYMLSCFLRYLENSGHKNPDWLGDFIAPPGGFPWRSGDDPETVGVWMWSEPFIVMKGNQEVAVLLIDTQGNFDATSGKANTSKAFIISLLMSSVMIYNKQKRIDEKDFEYLEFCVDYSKITMENEELCKLQNLKLLIRDWTDTKKYPHGVEGGNMYVEENILSDANSVSETTNRIRQKLRSSFHSTSGYLLPHPGLQIEDDNNDGSLKYIDDSRGFIAHLKTFVDHVLNPENLTTKEQTNGSRLVSFIIGISAALDANKSKFLPASSLIEITRNAAVSELLSEFCRRFEREMDEVAKVGFVSWNDFNQKRDEIINTIREDFKTSLPFKDRGSVQQSIAKFEDCVRPALNYARLNNEREERVRDARVNESLSNAALQLERKMNEVVIDRFVMWSEFDERRDEILKIIREEFVASLRSQDDEFAEDLTSKFDAYVTPVLNIARLNNELEEKIEEGAVMNIAKVLVREYEVKMQEFRRRATPENYRQIAEGKHSECKKKAREKFENNVITRVIFPSFHDGFDTLKTCIDCCHKIMELEFASSEVKVDAVRRGIEDIVRYLKKTNGKFTEKKFENTMHKLQGRFERYQFEDLKNLANEAAYLIKKRDKCFQKIKEGVVIDIANAIVREYEVKMKEAMDEVPREEYRQMVEENHCEHKKRACRKFEENVRAILPSYYVGLETLETCIDCSHKAMELKFACREMEVVTKFLCFCEETREGFTEGQFEDTLRELETECDGQAPDDLKNGVREGIDLIRKRNQCFKVGSIYLGFFVRTSAQLDVTEALQRGIHVYSVMLSASLLVSKSELQCGISLKIKCEQWLGRGVHNSSNL